MQRLELGALCYLAKAEDAVHLVEAVHAAALDKPYTSPSLAGALAGAQIGLAASTKVALAARAIQDGLIIKRLNDPHHRRVVSDKFAAASPKSR